MEPINNTELVITIISISIIFFVLSAFIIAFLFIQNRRRARHALEISNLKFTYEQTLLQSQLEIQEQTLQQVAYELHDNLGQVASLIKIHLNTIPLHDPAKAEQKVNAAKDLLRELILDLKHLTVSLNNDRITELGLVRGLERDAERLNATGKFTVAFHSTGIPYVDPSTTIILYRMAQEILNNSIKHSEAKSISVSIEKSDNLLTLVFTDDGVGFILADAKGNGGSGLSNLTKRASLINGRVTISSAPQHGTSVTIEIPF
jgi:two-component system, NarL family, sensor kinase